MTPKRLDRYRDGLSKIVRLVVGGQPAAQRAVEARPPTANQMLLTDRPISDPGSDELDLLPFLIRLMQPLVEVEGEESLVLGLYGPWGHGKTSALNLLERLFKKEGTTRAIVVRFNPWLYDDTQSLLLSFFGTLQAEIGGAALLDSKQKETLSRALEGLAAFATPLVAFLPHLAGQAITGSLKGASKLLRRGERDFREKKADVARVLTSLSKREHPLRVVVLIDDLDRAGQPEIRAMLKVVKLVADLPNVSYVLSMDDRRVRDVLTQDATESYGAEFLDKIVQVSVHLPPISPEKLRTLVIKAINEELALVGASIDPDEISTDTVTREFDYQWHVGRRVRTLRDRARFINTLRFVIRTGETKLDVSPRDLVLLSFLQTFYPDVYEAVRRNRDFLTIDEDFASRLAFHSSDKERVRNQREALFRAIARGRATGESVKPDDGSSEDLESRPYYQEVTPRVLGALFPNALSGERLTDEEVRTHRLQNRIDIAERFDRYFRLAPPSDEVSDEEVDTKVVILLAAVQSASDKEVADTMRALFAPNGTSGSVTRRDSFFEKFEDRLGRFQIGGLEELGRALVIADDVIGSTRVASLINRVGQLLQSTEFIDVEIPERTDNPATKLIEYEILNLTDATVAIDVANDYARRSVGVIRFDDKDGKTIARAGLLRARSFFQEHPDIFAELGPDANRLVWRWWNLLSLLGEPSDEVKAYTTNVLVMRPDSLSEILSLAAGWTDKPTIRDTSTVEILQSLNKTTDGATVQALVIERSQSPTGAYPYLIAEIANRIRKAGKDSRGAVPG
jgi:predicted KAP-like P-loop ATPase